MEIRFSTDTARGGGRASGWGLREASRRHLEVDKNAERKGSLPWIVAGRSGRKDREKQSHYDRSVLKDKSTALYAISVGCIYSLEMDTRSLLDGRSKRFETIPYSSASRYIALRRLLRAIAIGNIPARLAFLPNVHVGSDLLQFPFLPSRRLTIYIDFKRFSLLEK